MELRHIAMVNWHLFDVEDIAIAGNAGILGENASGKSTVLDMIQVVLTGASRSYLRLNAIAGEGARTRSGSRRSVHGYCLGTLREGEFRRKDAFTYLSLGFADRGGKRPPVSIGLALQASASDSSETVYGRFVAIGRILTTKDFLDERNDGRFPASWDEVKARIGAALGAERFVNHRDRALDYVREYMRHLVPTLPASEPSAAAMLKATVNAMSLNHGLSATEFVRNFILEDNPIRIGELRASIETYKGVNATIATMRRKLETLKEIQTALDLYQETVNRQALERWLGKRGRFLAALTMNRAHKARIGDARRGLEADREDIEALDEVIGEAEQEIERINAALAAHQAKTGRDVWADNLRRLDEQAASRDRLIAAQASAAAALGNVAGLPDAADCPGLAAIEAYQSAVTAPAGERRLAELREAEQALRAVVSAAAAWMAEKQREISALLHAQRNDLHALREKLDQSADPKGQAYLEDGTRRLMRRLESAGMDARPLCDLVEITDANWIPAAEALLARDREAIFVRRDEIDAATRLFKENWREFRRASLVSLNKLEPFREAPKPETLPAIFRSEDRDAMAFLQRRYGNVRLAETLDLFNLPGRALMKDGLYDDGLVRSHRFIEPRDHKIGKAAQAAAVAAMTGQLQSLAVAYSATEAVEGRLRRAAAALASIGEGASLAELLEEATKERGHRGEIVDHIAAIDAAGDGGLRERLRAQKEFLRLKTDQRKSIHDRNASYQTEIAKANYALGASETSDGSERACRLTRSFYAAERKLYSSVQGVAAYQGRLEPFVGKTKARSIDLLQSQAEAHTSIARASEDAAAAAKERMGRQELDLRRLLMEYFNDPAFGTSAQVGPQSHLLNEIRPWARTLIEDLEGNEIRRHEDKAREAAERIRTLVRGEFLNLLNQRIAKMERDLAQLNRSLRDHPFHNERYSFHATAEAEFRPVLEIVRISRISDDVLDMLFQAEMPEDFPHRDTVKAVEQLLEDPDKDFRAFEDYRNFHTFEIHMEDVQTGKRTRWETRRGTGSGAEQQVPLYVAIGASLASVFGTAQGGPSRQRGMAPALFDEAFSKLDGKNQRQMMGFYQDLGLQVVIAAPMEKKAAIMGYMETIVDIDRIGDQSLATVIRLKPKARDALLGMNPDFMSDEEIAAGLAAE